MSLSSLIFDLVVLGILIGCAAYYSSKGFAASLVGFFGTLLALAVAALLANQLAPVLFEHWVRPGMEARVVEAIENQNLTTVAEVLRVVIGFLPDAVIDAVSASVEISVDFTAGAVAGQIITQMVKPLVVPLIVMLLFFVLFLVLRLVVGLLGKALTGVNKLPVVGALNGAMGAVMGVLVGALYVFLLVCVIWALDVSYAAGTLEGEVFANSLVLKLVKGLNFF